MNSHPNQSLFLSEEFSDVTFIVDSESIPAHKIILAANCPYFKTMLFGATNESKMSTIELKNVSHKSFVEVLRCVYLRQVDIGEWTPEDVKQLILIADEYQFLEMGRIIGEALRIDSQITIDTIEDVIGAAYRLKCPQLVKKCADLARMESDTMLTNEDEFNKLPKAFIVHLIDKKIWNPADARLVYSIGNWHKTDSIEDKKRLLSKIDWRSLPGKYSAPLVQMFLENDLIGLQVNDWTMGLKKDSNLIAGVYYSHNGSFESTISNNFIALNNRMKTGCIVIFFREVVTTVKRIRFNYDGKASMQLKLYGDKGETVANGNNFESNWGFVLPKNVHFSGLVLQINNQEFGDKNFSKYADHHIQNFKFIFD